jgi:hypothetical protein
MAIDQVQFTDERWLQFWDNYKGLEHQQKAIIKLGRQIKQADPSLLVEGADWMDDWDRPVEAERKPAKLTPSSPFSARLTPHIQLGELALWQESRRFDHQHQVDTAAELGAFLERCRSHFGGKPVIITSGYRPPTINRAVGGASQSEHLFNAPGVGAVDFFIEGVSVKAVQDWCDANWPCSVGYGAPRGFVHLGIRKGRPRVRWDY